jgi:hypothetical protein
MPSAHKGMKARKRALDKRPVFQIIGSEDTSSPIFYPWIFDYLPDLVPYHALIS